MKALPATRSLLALALAAVVAGCASAPVARDRASDSPAAAAQVAGDSAKAERLRGLYDQYWEEVLQLNPIQATFQGDARYNDQLPNFYSAEYRDKSREFTRRWLETVESVGSDGLTGQDLLSYQIFVRDAKQSLESEKFPGWMMPVNQMGSLPTLAVQFGSGTGPQPFKTVQDYDNWLARAGRMPALFDTAIANMREGMKAGVVQPRALMVKVVPQLDALIKARPEDTMFWGPIQNMPKDFSAADRTRLTAAYRDLIAKQLMPSYRKLRTFINDEYLPATRETYGLDKLP
ncbi:MAG TPA: DUF885 family protein, partial [Lysobacter sp.]